MADKRKLTDRFIKAKKAAKPGKRDTYMDTDERGLGLRVTDTGAKSFILVARYPGTPVNPETGYRKQSRR